MVVPVTQRMNRKQKITLLVVLSCMSDKMVASFSISSPRTLAVPAHSKTRLGLAASAIEFQSDSSRYGRGYMHLSASINEGDVVVYQTGTWSVDGVEVGTGTPPAFEYALIENIQIVWTHNCEHGVLRGVSLELKYDQEGQTLVLMHPLNEVEFGPEQLVAKLPIEWDDDSGQGVCLATIDDSLWIEAGST